MSLSDTSHVGEGFFVSIIYTEKGEEREFVAEEGHSYVDSPQFALALSGRNEWLAGPEIRKTEETPYTTDDLPPCKPGRYRYRQTADGGGMLYCVSRTDGAAFTRKVVDMVKPFKLKKGEYLFIASGSIEADDDVLSAGDVLRARTKAVSVAVAAPGKAILFSLG